MLLKLYTSRALWLISSDTLVREQSGINREINRFPGVPKPLVGQTSFFLLASCPVVLNCGVQHIGVLEAVMAFLAGYLLLSVFEKSMFMKGFLFTVVALSLWFYFPQFVNHRELWSTNR